MRAPGAVRFILAVNWGIARQGPALESSPHSVARHTDG